MSTPARKRPRLAWGWWLLIVLVVLCVLLMLASQGLQPKT
jgi:hypothetical protein